MKTIRALLFFLLAPWIFPGAVSSARDPLPSAEAAAPPGYAELLARYVRPGGVRYAAWHAEKRDLERLGEVVRFYAGTRPPAGNEAALAWYLNAYNAWILHNILGKYPTRGPLDRDPLFFHGRRIAIAGEKMSFDRLEQKIIRPRFREPRIHFALNCASASCPPLAGKPFASATLDADLDRLARAFVAEGAGGVAARGSAVRLSKIFEWYAEDFGGKPGLLPFIARYRERPFRDGAEIGFAPYRWDLNEVE